MIFSVLLITRNGIKLYHRSYWAIEVSQAAISEFIQSMRQLELSAGRNVDLTIFVENLKFAHRFIDSDLLLVAVADPNDSDEFVQGKAENAARLVKRKFAKQIWEFKSTRDSSVFQDIGEVIDSVIVSTLKIVLLGEGGVGKTTILRLLQGIPTDLEHTPTTAVYVEQLEKVQLGPYEFAVWDFPGQEKMVPRWEDYLRGTDVVLIVTDSTLKNVMATRHLLPRIRKWTENALLWSVANKQDLEGGLLPATVGRLLGIPTVGLVAIDPRNKESLYRTLLSAAVEATIPPP
ncbi:MAG: ADP-ribosylation factor-like protein [Promethearchaeota archaeon]